jgi:hypothetical protein
MALSTGKVAGLLAAVLAIALLAFAAGFLLGLSTAHDLSGTRAGAPAGESSNGTGAAAGGATAPGDSAGGDGAAGNRTAGSGGAQPDAVGSDGSDAADGPSDDKAGADGGGDGGSAAGGGNGGDGGADGDGDGGADAADAQGDADGGAAAPAGYQVLAGAHAVEARAHAVARRLSDRGFTAQVVALPAADGPWFRVVLGGYDSLAAAREAAMQVRTEVGLDTLVAPPQPQAANAGPAE